jgi:hypothetical protein
MKRLLFVLAVAILALPAAALAKGPSEAKVSGPGLAKAIVIKGQETEGSPIMDIAEAAGFFPAAFGQTPDPMTSAAPKGTLGPKYSLDYVVPDGEGRTFKIHQDAYPYATPYPVTHMAADQPIFGMGTHGGWFVDTRLKEVLVAHGLPKSAAAATSGSSSSAGFFSTGKLGAVILVGLLLGGAFVLMRRRSGGATA